jgi:glycolate oxidase iron-sulfur subunit
MATSTLPLIERDLLRKCVHCGLCLPTCPTYELLGDERDSPRGRLFAMKAAVDGAIPLDDPMLRRHLDRCLGCRACETACPSGVQYGRVLEETRAGMRPASGRERVLRQAALDGLFAAPRRLDLAGWALRAYGRLGLGRAARRAGVFGLLPALLGEMEALLPAPQPIEPLPPLMTASGARAARVGLVTGCVMKQLFSGVNAATARVLQANGAEVLIPAGQGCCGALHLHSGERAAAQRLARALIDRFSDGLDALVVNAAGCGSTLKEYGHLLADDPEYAVPAERFARRVRDVAEWLDTAGLRPPPGELRASVTYQDACHLRHAQRVSAAPRALLRAIPGLELVEMEGAADCCGSAGIYNLTQPELARRLLERKMDRIEATGAAIIAVGNPGCALQIGAGIRARRLRMRVAHPVELLDRAYRL